MHPEAKLQNAPTFTGNGSHSRVCLLLVIKIKLGLTNTTVGRYQLTNRPTPIIGKMADPIPIIRASLVLWFLTCCSDCQVVYYCCFMVVNHCV